MANQLTLDYIKENYETYEDRMLAAFVGKPDKFWYYKRAFSKFNFNGIDKIKWVWSWWAFFFNWLFLLYRKAYLAAVIVLVLLLTLGLIPGVGLIISILVGGYAIYFIYKKYKSLKLEIENATQNEDERIKLMIENGGYNNWVIWLVIVLNILFVIMLIVVGQGGNYN